MRRAVIDIGTNSVKLLVAEVTVQQSKADPLLERGIQTRLGQGFYLDRLLQPGPVQETARACREFALLAKELHTEDLLIVATSAAREARNPEILQSAVLEATGHPVKVLSGELEAELAFLGVACSGLPLPNHVLIVDVGGGSTEFILGNKQSIEYRQSFPLGTVRTMESTPVSDPPTLDQFRHCESQITQFLTQTVTPSLTRPLQAASTDVGWIGTGGTSALLACLELKLAGFDREGIENMVIDAPMLRAQCESLWKLSLDERRSVPGLPPNRADVILFGSAIFLSIFEVFRVPEMRISTRGLRFGALLRL